MFVHCQRGADRTGAVIAAYHIDHDQWDNSRALKDARAHNMSVFQLPRQNFIRDFRPRTEVAAVTSPVAASVTQISAAASRQELTPKTDCLSGSACAAENVQPASVGNLEEE